MIRVFKHYIPKTLIVIGATEALILIASVYLGVAAHFIDFAPTERLIVGQLWIKALFFTVLMMVLMAGMGLYQRGIKIEPLNLMLRVGVAYLLGLIVLATVLYLLPSQSIGRTAFATAFVGSALGIVAFRVAVFHFVDSELIARRVLVLGAGNRANEVAALERDPEWHGAMIVGYVPAEREPIVADQRKILPLEGSLVDLVVKMRADEIVVAVDDRRISFPINDILDCKMSGIPVLDLVTFYERNTGKLRLDALNPSSIIFADGFIQAIIKGYLHRAFDIFAGILVLALVWPIMLLTACLIALESGFKGPVFYRQIRTGRNGEPFSILKFRSMRVDAEKHGAPQWAMANDVRITRVGGFIRKTRIDELPQLLNVLIGDMSFVGPRPERPEFVSELSVEIPYYDLRHRVNPGITGWAQICFPYGSSVDDAREKLQYDLYYIKNYSLFLDIMILIQTAQVVLWGKGAR